MIFDVFYVLTRMTEFNSGKWESDGHRFNSLSSLAKPGMTVVTERACARARARVCVCVCVCVCVFACVSVCLSVGRSIRLCVYLSVRLSVCVCVYACLSVRPSVCLSQCHLKPHSVLYRWSVTPATGSKVSFVECSLWSHSTRETVDHLAGCLRYYAAW